MPVGKGGNSSNESGSYSGNTAYQNQGESANVNASQTQQNQTQTQTGSQTGQTSGQTAGSQTGGFTNGVVDNYGIGDYWKGAAPVGVGDTTSNYFQNQLNRNSYTTATLERNYPDLYRPINDVSAGSVNAGTGAAAMGAYQTPLNTDYVNASLADYDAGAARGFNALRAGNADAFGNKRTGIAEGQFMADAARGRGALSANTRLNAFNTAAGYGQTDANRAAAVEAANADRALNASQFNNNFNFNREVTDAGLAYQGDQSRDSAANNLLASQTTGANARNAYVAAGSPLLGQTGTNYGNTTGSTTGSSSNTSNMTSTLENLVNSFGINLGAESGSGSGSSSGTKSGSSSSKGGGVSLG